MTTLSDTRITRRTFTAASVAALAGVFLAPRSLTRSAWAQGGSEMAIGEIASGMHVITGQGGNALVAVGDGGSVLIDCKIAGVGEALRELAETAGVPVAAVINTHHHGDHTGGNPAFTEDTPVHAHPACTPRVRAQVASQGKDPGPFLPTHEIKDKRVLTVAGVTAEPRHAGAGHTDNDVFVHFKDADVLHTGDLVFNELHPYFDPPAGSNSKGWIASCEAMLALCSESTVVVPGHGEVTDRGGIQKQIDYLTEARAAVREVLGAGKPRAAAEALELPVFEGYGFGQLRGRALGSIYAEMAAEDEE